jgi:hypothetical protein
LNHEEKTTAKVVNRPQKSITIKGPEQGKEGKA